MTINYKNIGLFFLVACLILGTGFVQSWNTALFILNMGLVSAIMALGVNLQWGFAGLFNVGIMGFVALGGLAAVLISMPPTTEAWAAGGLRVILGIVLGAATVTAAILVQLRMAAGRARTLTTIAILIGGFFIYRAVFDGGVAAVEAVDAAGTGYLGGLNFGGASYKDWGFMTLISWPVRRAFGGWCRLAHWQDCSGSAFRLSRHCHAWDFRNHHCSDEKRRLAVARCEERDRPAPPGAL